MSTRKKSTGISRRQLLGVAGNGAAFGLIAQAAVAGGGGAEWFGRQKAIKKQRAEKRAQKELKKTKGA